MEAFEPGARLGPFEIQHLIGAGGMGTVYRARDLRLGRTVAIKVLTPRTASRGDALQRFEREARAVSSLNHPNICTLHDIGQQDSVTFLVMEYLDGTSLAERLTRGPLPIEEALRYATEIANALGEAHRHGIVHRDLKPGNLVLTKNGAKLLDSLGTTPDLSRRSRSFVRRLRPARTGSANRGGAEGALDEGVRVRTRSG